MASGFNLNPVTTANAGFNFGSSITTTTAAPSSLGGLSFSFPSVTSAAGSTAGTSLFSAPPAKTTSTPSVFPSMQPGITSVATTCTTSSTSSAESMSFRQLEELINKWTLDLEEQEKVFINQATLVNAWDRMLIGNGEKITVLNDSIERVKLDQQRLDHELDFILAQQKELEDILTPLERSVEANPTISLQQHADLEREHMYQMAENIDVQLKRMAEDLKEVIDHLNTTNSNKAANDQVSQVSRILNAHMDSLQWIDQNVAVLQKKLEETEKLYEVHKKEHQKTLRLVMD